MRIELNGKNEEIENCETIQDLLLLKKLEKKKGGDADRNNEKQ